MLNSASRILVVGAAALLLPGCAAPDAGGAAPAETIDAAMLQSPGESMRSRLLNREAGLEVRRWVCRDDASRIAEAVAAHMDGHPVDDATRRRLLVNGFRLVRVPLESLDAMAADLGGLTTDIEGWYGQVYDWQELHRIAAGTDRRAVVFDGRAERVDEGEFRLVLRTWIVRTEDGPRVHVRIVPTYRIGTSLTYSVLLGDELDEGRPLPSGVIDLLLEPGYACVLMGASPGTAWRGWSSEEELEAAAEADGAPTTGPGPIIEPPVTIGELMLSSRKGMPSRGLLVLIPRVPESMRIPETLADSTVEDRS